ncbi:MAG TPA: hypothetical protein VFQ86_12875 [Arachidicoccus soli]|uniref:Uncharacterized protein n=1 Tax=Arachidicoccus soli TaxID=2341117 RepID=A0A386HT12_9BACT|nr:hypothetical protein [Arachidicoccus soli]AYD49077.1 hypothetical protein D6B99_16500 [Arachidicoccus soli]HEU0228627.1 hypothetical protein [Arachidicoccus soli]
MKRNEEILEVMEWLYSMKDDFFFVDENIQEIEKSKVFLEKYWIGKEEYESKFSLLQTTIFNQDSFLPQNVFKDHFKIFGIDLAGGTFFKEEYGFFHDFLLNLNEEYFFIIENNCTSVMKEKRDVLLRFKFPASITYQELASGGTISNILLKGRYPKDYFVFGESASWGKYAANIDYDLYMIGFSPSIEKQIRSYFMEFTEDNKKLIRLMTPTENPTAREMHYSRMVNYLPSMIT